MRTAARTSTAAHDSSAPTHRAAPVPTSPLTGLGSLVRLYGRLSRRAVLIWTLAVLTLVPASILAMQEA
ncbi:hypothetical protein [Brachybacterium vulturis]|uniref:hypothetical protein n=1 Tax=Brachybacterium vulturis TaxID=2017484 RepID=UPI00373708F7